MKKEGFLTTFSYLIAIFLFKEPSIFGGWTGNTSSLTQPVSAVLGISVLIAVES